MMKKLLQNLVLPFALFSSGILLIGCEQATEPNQQDIQTESSEQHQSANTQSPEKAELKSGMGWLLMSIRCVLLRMSM